MSGFRQLDTTGVATAGFLALDEVAIEGPDGQRHSRYVVRHPGAVVVVPLDDDRAHVWCLRQYRAAADRELLEIPAGKRDVDGEAPEETAARELAEELGRHPGRLVKLCEFYNSPGFCDEYTYLYCALDLVPAPTVAELRAEEQHMTVERVALANVAALVAAGEIVDAKTIAGLLLAARFVAGDYAGMASAP